MNDDGAINPYAYLDKDGFTSEIYKLEIKNLDTRVGFTQLKKRLNTLGINPHKMKILRNVTFVTFKSSEERDNAINLICGHEWKGKTLHAKIAAARTDPFLQKRKDNAEENLCDSKKIKMEDNRTNEEKLKDHVIKFWRKNYSEQLKEKESKMVSVLTNLYERLKKENKEFDKLSSFIDKHNDSIIACRMLSIIPSPVEKNYRNKCEFTIGMTLEGDGPITGFCHGKYRGGINAVGDVQNFEILSPKMYPIINSMNEFSKKLLVEKSLNCCDADIDVYTPGIDKGHLRSLTIRVGNEGMLINLDIHPQQLLETQIAELGRLFVDHFLQDSNCHDITGLLMSIRKNNSDAFDRATTKILFGSEYIHEKLINDLQFRISFNAFFQVNTLAANTLYKTIRDLLVNEIVPKTTSKITLLDICCGTGTIGIVMADLVERVVGIDIIEESIEDAKHNAKLNKIDNVEYHVGKVEDVFDNMISLEENRIKNQEDKESREFVAIVDPPRGGLHNNVIHSIRKCRLIKKLIYVSCNPEAATNNFLSLCRPISKRTHGEPFKPELAIPVDLFPQTPHVEMVMLFSR